MSEFKREVRFRPAFDKRHADPTKNFGIHGAEMVFLLTGDLGIVQFVVYTNWHLPNVRAELDSRVSLAFPHLMCHPLPADIGYHSPKQIYETQKPMERSLLPAGQCYYGGSSLGAERFFDILVREGSDAVWAEMEGWYRGTLMPTEADRA